MNFKRCCISLLLSFCLLLSMPISSLADLSTDSQAVYATDSQAIQPVSFDIAPFSSISTVQNTVNYSGVSVALDYYDMSNNFRSVYVKVNSDGTFNFNRPSDCASGLRFFALIEKASLPPSGTYEVTADFGMHTPMTYSKSFAHYHKIINNATLDGGETLSFSLIQSYGDFQVSGILKLGNVDSIRLGAYISSLVPTSIGGKVSINFTKSSSTPNASLGSDLTSQDIQTDISNNTSQMVDQQEETNGLLVQIISTISNQLTAFWNQLAGEFTNLFNKMNQQHQAAMEAVEDQTSRIEDSVQDQTQKIQDKLEDVKTGIISGIINGLKSLFIPSDDFFKTYFDDLFSWFSDRLGFLSFPIDLLAQLVEMFLGSSSTDFVVTLPSFEIMGEPLLQEASFNLTQFLNENFGFLLTAIHLGVSVIMVFGFIKLCERKWEEVMMN